jgi:hypothetical protein
MAAKLGVLLVHGMGDQSPSFGAKFIADMERRLRKLRVPADDVVWGSGYWAGVLNNAQRDLWDRMSRENDLDWGPVRRFFLYSFADAVAYRRNEGTNQGTYRAIHQQILAGLRGLQATAGREDLPLIVLAHSLGATIMSDYIWNEQRNNALQVGQTPLERMQTLCGFVTFGCTIPLFSLALPQVEAIEFPAPQLPDALRRVARWTNYYDPDDVMGWPLRSLDPSYARVVHSDVAINVGGVLTSWSPASHGRYWDDDNFVAPVARQIRDVHGATP